MMRLTTSGIITNFYYIINMYRVEKYNEIFKKDWDNFVRGSKNGTFILLRDYMDYHKDKFHDNSLLVYKNNKLIILLPANRFQNTLYSHQGLTYGGFIMSKSVSTIDVLEAFKLILSILINEGFDKFIYKPIPYIYHKIPAQEDLYALFRYNAKVTGCQLSSAIFQRNKLKFTESRKSGIRKAKSNNVQICETDDFTLFWEVLTNNLLKIYNTKPVHTLYEISYLKSLFPDNIKLFITINGDKVTGGTVVYISDMTVHIQYIAASDEGKSSGVLDLLFDYLINEKYLSKPFFDFGYSTENSGSILNESLIFQKEGFGGRGVVYYTFEFELNTISL